LTSVRTVDAEPTAIGWVNQQLFFENDHTKTIVAKWDAESQRVAETLEFPACFKIDSEPLNDALERIGRQYEFKVVIDPAVIRASIDLAMKVTLNTCRVPLRDVLTALLKQSPKPLVYKLENRVVRIVPAPGTK
jgi:predicted P-loop ATPase